MNQKVYCNKLTGYSRLNTREVAVGNSRVGGACPIRIQSMTNTATSDVSATVDQCIRIADAGADYVRIAVPSVKDAHYLKQIKDGLAKKGYQIPLIADVHFNPEIAEVVSPVVEKIRINPGNYAGKKHSDHRLTAEEAYQEEMAEIRNHFLPLIQACKKNRTTIRIGTNHGSLAERIFDRYGDTPAGMAASAVEFLKICSEESFFDLVVSMKASNPIIMVQATRLLVHQMLKDNKVYPLHLGVTEAGEGEDGRLKSAAGIGALLIDGIGDTIRVSLTEEPEKEIPVAGTLVKYISEKIKYKSIKPFSSYPVNPFEYNRRVTRPVINIGGNNMPVVICSFTQQDLTSDMLEDAGWIFDTNQKKWKFTEQSADLLYLKSGTGGLNLPAEKGILTDYDIWRSNKNIRENIYPLMNVTQYTGISGPIRVPHFISITYNDLTSGLIGLLKNDQSAILVAVADNISDFYGQRGLIIELMLRNCYAPVILRRSYNEPAADDFRIKSAADSGILFIDGLGDGIWLSDQSGRNRNIVCSTAFGILQATRARISRVEYISCPSCGRTHFNIMEVSAAIREKTSHLKGLKIGIMGCIVNGVGEMADADYGYVGSGKGKINLYKARQLVLRNIPESEAVDALVQLIKENNDWRESPQ